MNATQQFHELGQSLWLDNITHSLLTSGTLARHIRELGVTGLTSNPSIFDHAINRGRTTGLADGVVITPSHNPPEDGGFKYYWGPIAERYGLDLTVVSNEVDPTFRFMTVDWDGRIRMDPSTCTSLAAFGLTPDEGGQP